MAYMDEMALEREKSRQSLLAGKQPLLGADTTTALHALGVNLGIVPPGTPPSQMTQLLAGLLKGPSAKDIRVDEQKPLQVQPLVGQVTSSLQRANQSDDSIGETISGGFGAAKDKALQQKLQVQQKVQPPTPPQMPERPPGPGSNRARLGSRAERSPEGPTYKADIAFLNERGGHNSVLKDGKIVSVPVDAAGTYKTVDPELAARLRAAGEAYEKANPGKKAQFGEFSRGEDVQKVYHDKYLADGKSIAAPPGRSGHQVGRSGDLPDSHFRQWLNAGNKDQFGLHFPVKGDAPHVEVNGSFKGPSFSNPPAASATPSAPSAAAPGTAATSTTASATGNTVLAEQRKPIAQFFDGNPRLKEQMAAAAWTEDNNSPEGRIAVHEAGANRINAAGRPVGDIIDPKYYAAMSDPAQRPKYDAALKRVQTDPQFKAMLYAEMDQAHKQGTNYSNLATDFGSGNTAAQSKTNSTHVGKVGGNDFFIKDKTPEVHGAGTVANNQKWRASTEAAIKGSSSQPAPQAPAQPPQAEAKPTQAAAAPAAATPNALPPGAAAIAATEAEQLLPEDSPDVPATASAEPTKPATPAPVAAAPLPPAPAAAAAPVKPSAAPPPAPPPVAKPAPPAVNPAHALLDTKVIELVKRGDPSKVSQVPDMIGNKTLREAMGMPFIGGQIAAGVAPYLPKMGITQQQFDSAVKEGAPKPATLGKRTDLGTSGATDFSASKRMAPAPAEAAAPAVDPNAATLDPLQQKPVQNEDGSISTVRTIGVEDQGKEVNIPTVPAEGGRVMSDADARQRYLETGNHLGKFDTVEQAGAAAEKLHQDEAARISEQPKGQQGAMTPEMAQALTNVYKDESRVTPDPSPPPADAMPVLPAQPAAPAGGTAGGLSLAPSGLSQIPTGTIPGQGASQGGSIAMAGMLPPIDNATFSSPLLNSAAASGSSPSMGLSPIPMQTLGGWGWGGGSSIGAGLDWGGGGGFDLGGGGGFTMPSFGTGGW
jgi:hypothetical protein